MTEGPDALVSAALRHLRDAEHLAQQGPHRSLEQALHLLGYAPECARKACLVERWGGTEGHKAVGHEFNGASEEIVNVLVALDARAHRYRPLGWGTRFPNLMRWNVGYRYWRTGAARAMEQQTRGLLAEARLAVDETVLALWTDGLLGPEALAT